MLDQLVVGKDYKLVMGPAVGPQLECGQDGPQLLEMDTLAPVAFVDPMGERLVWARCIFAGRCEITAQAEIASVGVEVCDGAAVVVQQAYPVKYRKEVSPPSQVSSNPARKSLWDERPGPLGDKGIKRPDEGSSKPNDS